MYELATTIMQDRLREAERHRLGRSVRLRRPARQRLAERLIRVARALAPELPGLREVTTTWPCGGSGTVTDPRAAVAGR